jgi:hypothetical protein
MTATQDYGQMSIIGSHDAEEPKRVAPAPPVEYVPGEQAWAELEAREERQMEQNRRRSREIAHRRNRRGFR